LSLVTPQVLQESPLPLALQPLPPPLPLTLQPLPPPLKHLSLLPLATLLKHHLGGDLPHHWQVSPTVQRGAEGAGEEVEEEEKGCEY